MFSFRHMKKTLSVILSSCTLGCLSSFFVVNGDCNCDAPDESCCSEYSSFPNSIYLMESNTVAVPLNTGDVRGALLENFLDRENEGNIEIAPSNDSSYALIGNTINFGQNSNLIRSNSKLPTDDCELYVRAVKVKDGLGNDILYDPNTSNVHYDTGWVKFEGLATLNYLADSAGLWNTYTVQYFPSDSTGQYQLKHVVLDKSRSMDGINRYNLIDSNGKVLVPMVMPSYNESAYDVVPLEQP